MAEEKSRGFLARNWKIALVIAIIAVALVLFIIIGTKSAVSPDVAYFPT